jgi:hypothetical protein
MIPPHIEFLLGEDDILKIILENGSVHSDPQTRIVMPTSHLSPTLPCDHNTIQNLIDNKPTMAVGHRHPE